MTLHDLFSSLAALALVVALIWLALRVLQRAGLDGRRETAGRLRVLARLPLDPRRRLLLVALDGQEILVLTGGPNDLVLPIAPPAPTPALPTASIPPGLAR